MWTFFYFIIVVPSKAVAINIVACLINHLVPLQRFWVLHDFRALQTLMPTFNFYTTNASWSTCNIKCKICESEKVLINIWQGQYWWLQARGELEGFGTAYMTPTETEDMVFHFLFFVSCFGQSEQIRSQKRLFIHQHTKPGQGSERCSFILDLHLLFPKSILLYPSISCKT